MHLKQGLVSGRKTTNSKAVRKKSSWYRIRIIMFGATARNYSYSSSASGPPKDIKIRNGHHACRTQSSP